MKIPGEILALFDKESEGLTHGAIRLELFLRDGRPRFVLARERSLVPGTDWRSEDMPLHTTGKKKESLSIAPVLRKGGDK
jgi:hypothetical protein